MSSTPKKIILLGMASKMPVAGVVWQTLHYIVGFRLLGHDAYYVEEHARTPSMFMTDETDDASSRAAEFIDGLMRRFDLGDRWAFHALHGDGHYYGMSESRLKELFESADVVINLHGGTFPLPHHSAAGKLVYLETDPVQLQIELHDGLKEAIDFLAPHHALFTFGENYGRPDCGLPVSERFPFRPTRQPVVMDFWAQEEQPRRTAFTTIANWQQDWRTVQFNGETYHWSKHYEFLKIVDLPQRAGPIFELALSSCNEATEHMLKSYGWTILPALSLSTDIDTYKRYITSSAAEFTVAKDQNVRLHTGWFSDRSATYLAAGRPVITQNTGFASILPTDQGLFSFDTMEDILAAVETIRSDYEKQCRAARAIAHEYFSHDVVLNRLLDDIGV
jgi:hypothetical protein